MTTRWLRAYYVPLTMYRLLCTLRMAGSCCGAVTLGSTLSISWAFSSQKGT